MGLEYPVIIRVSPLATRSIFNFIPAHKSTLWDIGPGSRARNYTNRTKA